MLHQKEEFVRLQLLQSKIIGLVIHGCNVDAVVVSDDLERATLNLNPIDESCQDVLDRS